MTSPSASLNDSFPSEIDSAFTPHGTVIVDSTSSSASDGSELDGHEKCESRRSGVSKTSRSALPQKVTTWTRKHVEKNIGIVYAKNYSRGLQALKPCINGKINEFTKDQLDYMELVDKYITFSLTLSNFYIEYPFEDSRAEEELSLAESMIKEYDRKSSNWDFVLKIKKFIKGLRKFHRDIRYYKGSRKSLGIAGGLLTHLVGRFAELCCLDVEYCNQACQAEMDLYGTIVRSQPDLRVYKSGLECEASNYDTMVSVIEVKPRYEHHPDPVMGPPKKRFKGSPSRSDYGIVLETDYADAIALNVRDDVLGQHAGELLLDLHLKYRVKSSTDYQDDCKVNKLGMIVDGSLVYFTVLEMTWKHYQKLKGNKPLEPEDKATIHYTSPQNFLMGPERSVLVREFMRLNNIDFL